MGIKPMPWSDAKKARFLELAAEGKTTQEIVNAMGISTVSVGAAARRFGVKVTPTRPSHVHSDEAVAKVMTEMLAGKSAAMVAAMIGKTRNVVIGIWHRTATTAQRLTHAARQQRPTRRPVSKLNRPCTPRKAVTAALEGAPRTADRRSSDVPLPADTTHKSAVFDGVALVSTLLDLEPHHCRWPAGKGFCGHLHRDGSPYCERHHARAHAQPTAIHTPTATARMMDESRGIISR